jgi:probable rRNA maturation factor
MSPGNSTILFRAIPPPLRLTTEEKRSLRQFARDLTANILPQRPFLCLVTNDAELRKLNLAFLRHDYATDVLSFPAASPTEDSGELAISIERAREQAAAFGHGAVDELRILMLHGVLHLAGMDHERDRGAMSREERKWRAEFGLPQTLIARTKKRRSTKAAAR